MSTISPYVKPRTAKNSLIFIYFIIIFHFYRSKPSTSKPETEGQQKDKEVVNKIAVKRKAPPPQASKKSKKDSSASQPAENVTPSSSQVS